MTHTQLEDNWHGYNLYKYIYHICKQTNTCLHTHTRSRSICMSGLCDILSVVSTVLFFTFKHGVVRVRLQAEGTPDTVISGTPAALFAMAEPEEADWGLPESKVQINGDASLARDLERIFSKLEPDWEGPLAGMLGDVAGHQVAQGLRQGVETARETARSTSKVLSDVLKDRNS